MKKIVYSLLLVVLVSACSNNKKSSAGAEDESMVSFFIKDFSKKSELANFPESELTANIPLAKADEAIAKKINDAIFESVKSVIGEEGDTCSVYETLFSKFISDYETFVKQYPDFPRGWEATIKGSVERNTSKIINVKLESYVMTGGAHGNTNIYSLLFDPKTGEELSLKKLVKDTTSLARIAEEKFRVKYNIPNDKPINSTGLMFPGDKFVLPQNIFVKEDTLLLLYNRYEIAAYVQGTKEIALPYDEVKKYLAIDIN